MMYIPTVTAVSEMNMSIEEQLYSY